VAKGIVGGRLTLAGGDAKYGGYLCPELLPDLPYPGLSWRGSPLSVCCLRPRLLFSSAISWPLVWPRYYPSSPSVPGDVWGCRHHSIRSLAPVNCVRRPVLIKNFAALVASAGSLSIVFTQVYLAMRCLHGWRRRVHATYLPYGRGLVA